MLLPGMAFIFVLFKVKVDLLLLLNHTKPDKAQQKQKPRYMRLKGMYVLFSTQTKKVGISSAQMV